MKDIVGSPGTRSSLALRVLQFVCAISSTVAVSSVLGSSYYSAYCYLIIQMSALSIWSMLLVCLDAMALKKNWDLHITPLVWVYLIADWALAIGSLAVVSSGAAVTILFERDIKLCDHLSLNCSRLQVSIILGSMAWAFISASATSTFHLLVALYE